MATLPSELDVVASDGIKDVAKLEDVVDREALMEVCRSFFDLFGLSIRVVSASGTLLADMHEQRSICRYVNGFLGGKAACRNIVSAVRETVPDEETVVHPCFTGAQYRIVPIVYHGRRVGRFVVGPYMPAEQQEIAPTLLNVDPGINAEEVAQRMADMPKVREDTAQRIVTHLRGITGLLLFSGHRAHLTSEMHIASVRESYRELAEKTAKLQTAYDRLKDLDRLKSNFLATVSHELRTPLTSVIGYAEMLESGMAGDLNSEQQEFVRTIHEKGEHLLALITSLLDLSKLEQGALTVKPESVDPAALLSDIEKTMRPHAHKKNIRFDVDVAEGVPGLQGDPMRLRQVLFNLTENALKFTPEGGIVHLSVEPSVLESEGDMLGAVLMAAPEQAVKFTVRDTGMGMPKSELSKIFDAFYQVDGSSTREHGGAGLGLSIVKRLVDAHDGTVRVESEVGSGTSFMVTLPAS